MTDFTIDDMITNALEGKPEAFRNAFNDIMVSKIADAVELRKQEIAQSLYPDAEDQNDQESDESDEEDLETYDTEDENVEEPDENDS